MTQPTRRELRSRFRKRRRALSSSEQLEASQAIADHFRSTGLGASHRRWGLYVADDGEPSLEPWRAHLCEAGSDAWFPALDGKSLRFASMDRVRENRFGILEPDTDAQPAFSAAELDVLLLPLVAWDASGTRLGRGGGFYDRTLAEARPRPILIGVAHDCQFSEMALPRADHDVPLDAIVSPARLRVFNPAGEHAAAFGHNR